MKSKKDLLSQISTKMGVVKEKLIIENSINDYSLNIHIENTYLEILNEIYEYNLVNANSTISNHVAVDGIDINKGIYVQITSTFSTQKIYDTVAKLKKHKLTDKCNTLLFVFLKGKKKLTAKSRNKILKEINNEFQLDFENHFLDNSYLFNDLLNSKKYEKIVRTNELFNEILGSITDYNQYSIPTIGITFSDSELTNVFDLVKNLLKRSLIIKTTSSRLINSCEEEGLSIQNRLVYVSNTSNFNNITKFIAILSNDYILDNLKSKNPKLFTCSILEFIVKKDKPLHVYTFDHYLENQNFIGLDQFKSYRTIDIENYDVEPILNDLFENSVEIPFDIKEYKNPLIKHKVGFNLVKDDFLDTLKFHHYQFKNNDYEEFKVNYLIVEKGYNQSALIDYIKTKYLSKTKEPYTILLPKDGVKTRSRLKVFSELLELSRVYFLDDYLFDQLLKKTQSEYNFEDESFIKPIILKENQRLGLNDILYWITNDSKSTIALLAGAGGIGKTTVCEKIHHEILHNHDRYVVIFINPSTFIEAFSKINFDNSENYDLYNVYKFCNSDEFLIDEEIFNINLYTGNIVIIFDGIDEVVSTLESFNINHFLEKISKVRKGFGKGKILVNCRDTYIEDVKNYYKTKKLNSLEFFELQAFNKTLANQYFQKRFPKEPRKVSLAENLLLEYLKNDLEDNNYLYPPFVLECIGYYLDDIVLPDSDEPLLIDSYDFNSELLIDDITDYIIFNVCKREILKKKEHGFVLNVDDQVKFMIDLSINEKGSIDESNMRHLLIKNGFRDRVERLIDTVKDHPFLYYENKKFKFRFSFLKTHFEALALHKLILKPDYFEQNTILLRALSIRGSYNSLTFKNILHRFKNSKTSYDNLVTFSKNLMAAIKNDSSLMPFTQEKAISNVFVLIHKICSDLNFPTNSLIKDLFENSKNIIEFFYLIDIPDNYKLKLDFSNMIFQSSKIRNYQFFFASLFNQDTFFYEDCEIKNVVNNNLDYSKISASEKNFDKNIKGDNSIHKTLHFKDQVKYLMGDVIQYFFKCFFNNSTRNASVNIKYREIENNYDFKIPSLDLLIDVLIKNEIITKVSNKQIYLNKDMLRHINKYVLQGLEFRNVKRSINMLVDELKNER